MTSTRIIFGCIVIAVSLLMALPMPAFAHPYEDLVLLDIPGAYGICNLPWEADFAEVSFTHEFPAPESLTAAEQFMISGSENSPNSATSGLLPWWQYVFAAVRSFHSKYGYVPSELSEEMLLDLSEGNELPYPEWFEVFRSPITEQYPRLDALYGSPGDLYIRELTESEIQHVSNYDLSLQTIYFEHKFYPEGMYSDPGLRSTQTYQDVTHVGPVFFIRVHGWDGVIWELVSFTWSVDE